MFRRANELWRGPFEMHHPDQLGLEVAGIGEQHDRVVVNLNDKRRDIDPLEASVWSVSALLVGRGDPGDAIASISPE